VRLPRLLFVVACAALCCGCLRIHWPVPSPSPSPAASTSPAPAPSPSEAPSPEPSPSLEPSPSPSPVEPSPSPTATATPTPSTSPTPAACPPLVRVGGGVLVVGPSFTWLDSTPRFGRAGSRGQACNDEHPAFCGGRRCEDPRGNRWEVRGGLELLSVGSPGPEFGFQAKVRGSGEAQVCPLDDAHDAEGVPLVQLPDNCSGWFAVP
jgi:hypothetical protein